MKRDTMARALNEISDRHLLEAAEAVSAGTAGKDGKQTVNTKKLLRTLLIAAVLTTFFTITAYAVYQRAIHPKVPETPEDLTFNVVTDKEKDDPHLATFRFDDLAMIIHFDTDPDGHEFVFRDGWLPEIAANSDRLQRHSYYEELEYYANYELYPDWEKKTVGQWLAESGLSEEEAGTWFTRVNVENPGPKPLLDINIHYASELYVRDVILGFPSGSEAHLIKEGDLGPYQLLEVEVDTSAFYNERDPEEDHSDISLQNHLFLFEPEQQYMIHIGGSACAYPFEDLEKIGENLEVRMTGIETRTHEMDTTFLFSDLGRG